jgi:hypothetical protein
MIQPLPDGRPVVAGGVGAMGRLRRWSQNDWAILVHAALKDRFHVAQIGGAEDSPLKARKICGVEPRRDRVGHRGSAGPGSG